MNEFTSKYHLDYLILGVTIKFNFGLCFGFLLEMPIQGRMGSFGAVLQKYLVNTIKILTWICHLKTILNGPNELNNKDRSNLAYFE